MDRSIAVSASPRALTEDKTEWRGPEVCALLGITERTLRRYQRALGLEIRRVACGVGYPQRRFTGDQVAALRREQQRRYERKASVFPHLREAV